MKLENQLSNVRFLAARKQSDAQESEAVIVEIEHLIANLNLLETTDNECLKKIRYFEASVAQQYWQLIGKKLPEPFSFATRTKRNPTDVFNPYINYLYGMLRNQVETAILSIGLDPALGCMHRDGYKLPSLVFDLMEPFRPITDRFLIEEVLSGKITSQMETGETGSYLISRPGRKMLIELFNGHLHKTKLYKRTKTSLLNHILLETRCLADQIKHYEE